ncbi:putative Calpain-1 catalytic subunit [Glarea lozoyensis 74030]|uniref:Putative Calpain-1 catalytic subunit n=1 Tax=Glarea lozoyensis (strain ATCC 74030 / MF5533) TaxID=1104152 RepID=H0ENZ1_GLAL7|nr:putative Calpain-1 catalytic subunit [Glarea lozoyensis 74030]
MRCVEADGKRFCLIRNPWGQKEWTGAWSDGSKEWTPYWIQKLEHRFGDDGQFWMTYEDLLRTYQIFDRTRLFSEEWKVTQQWTSLTVPWSVDYNETKFSFTIEREASVVIVLSQSRTRVDLNVNLNRSVSAELTLEAGEYHVLMKVEAEKYSELSPPEDVLRDNVKGRREKVLRVGLSYDMAHAKGVIFETEEEKKAKQQARQAEKTEVIKRMKKVMFTHKQRDRHRENRQARRRRAAALKRKAKAESKKARNLPASVGLDAKPTEESSTSISDETPEPTNEIVEDDSSTSKSEQNPVLTSAEVHDDHNDQAAAQMESTAIAPNAQEDATDSDSDLESISSTVSTVSTFAAEDMIELNHHRALQAKEEADERAMQNPQVEESEDEFEADPWNAVAVVGLRIYAKGCGVALKVVRPRSWENKEGALDIDDSAKDATKGNDVEVVQEEGGAKE